MAETDADRFRQEAEECRRLAERSASQLDKEAWLRLAADWIKLAENVSNDSPGGCENKAGLFHLQVEETVPVQLRLTECGHPQ